MATPVWWGKAKVPVLRVKKRGEGRGSTRRPPLPRALSVRVRALILGSPVPLDWLTYLGPVLGRNHEWLQAFLILGPWLMYLGVLFKLLYVEILSVYIF